MFGKHLPPSAGRPRVLALDERAAAELTGLAQVTPVPDAGDLPEGPFDAIAGRAAPEQVRALYQRLRPGGRLILTDGASPEALLGVLTQAGLVHCLVEPQEALCLYRGERPPRGSPLERMRTLAASEAEPAPSHELPITPHSALTGPYIFLLITQTPHKPAWKLAPGERVSWRAATVMPAAGQAPVLLAFSSLVKAVAYLQRAVMARAITDVTKVGKFPTAAAGVWPLPLTLNPDFEATRELAPGPPLEVEPQAAITGDE